MSISEKQKLLILNQMTLVVISVTLFMGILDVFSGLYVHMVSNILFAAILFSGHRYIMTMYGFKAAAVFFVLATLAFIILICEMTISQNRPTDVENILFAFSASIIFLFEGHLRRSLFFLVTLMYCLLKLQKFYLHAPTFDWSFSFNILNSIIVFYGIYFFSRIFRKGFIEALDESEKLNERIRIEADQHKETRQLLDSLVNNLPLMVVLLDLTGRLQIANNQFARLIGRSKEEILGKTYTEVLPKQVIKQHQMLVQAAITNGKSAEFLEDITRGDSETRSFLGSYIPIKSNTETKYLAVFATDITHLKQNERRLERVNTTKNKLFSVLAHELKGPVAMLQSSLSLQSSGSLSAEEWGIASMHIQQRLDSLSFTLANVLAWAKAQFEGFQSNKIRLDIQLIIEAILDKSKPLLESKSISVRKKFDHLKMVFADENQIRIVIMNILNNAIKFVEEKGIISIETYYENEFVIVRIKNNGQLIPKPMLHKINHQEIVESMPGTAGEKGTGLGLMICQELLKENQGKLQVENYDDGVGFSIYLPATV